MTQPLFSAVRTALAARLGTISGLRAYADRAASISPPVCLVLPPGGTFMRYDTMDGAVQITLRAVLLISLATSAMGQDIMDPYLATTGPQSIWAALSADPTLGGTVHYAALTEVTTYGTINVGDVDYLGCHFIIDIGI